MYENDFSKDYDFDCEASKQLHQSKTGYISSNNFNWPRGGGEEKKITKFKTIYIDIETGEILNLSKEDINYNYKKIQNEKQITGKWLETTIYCKRTTTQFIKQGKLF